MTDETLRGGRPVAVGTVAPSAVAEFRARAEQARQRAADRPARTVDLPSELMAARAADERAAAHRRWLETWPTAVPRRYQDARVDQLDDHLARLADEWDGTTNVLLLGSVGVGKTHAAVAIARTAFETGRTVMFRPCVRLLDELRPGGRDGALEEACEVDVLVLDDLGAERPTDWTAERLHAVVADRYDECRPTIVTSNLSGETIGQAHPRIWSRLYDSALAAEIAGADRRRKGRR